MRVPQGLRVLTRKESEVQMLDVAEGFQHICENQMGVLPTTVCQVSDKLKGLDPIVCFGEAFPLNGSRGLD